MNYILLTLSILLAVAVNTVYHKLAELGTYNRFFFTACSSLVWLVALAWGGRAPLTVTEVAFGVAYGAVQGLFLYFKMQAMRTGPLSVTSVVGNCSMLLTTVFGVLVFSESVGVFQVLGVVAILLSVVLCTDPKADMAMTTRWKWYCGGFFVFAASVGIIFKLFARTAGNGNNMMLVSAATMVVVMFALSFTQKEKRHLTRGQMLCALLAGAASCGYNRLNLYLSGALPTVVFFPIFNGAVVLGTTLAGAALFRETFTKKQLIGIAVGMAAILCLSGLFGI